YRLAQGPQDKLTNIIVLEEAHNLLLKKSSESRESVLETSIRMVRQYGLGYVFVDQSASLLSSVAFANSYATIALSQKLRSDVQTIAGAMNLTDEQKQALNTLPIGAAVVRLADEHPEPGGVLFVGDNGYLRIRFRYRKVASSNHLIDSLRYRIGSPLEQVRGKIVPTLRYKTHLMCTGVWQII
ncbi:hypothetical protein ACFL5Z_18615, partial [Planctomycetota bacterium]